MTRKQAAEILEQHNRWRRGDDEYQMVDVRLLGIAIDVAVAALRESAE